MTDQMDRYYAAVQAAKEARAEDDEDEEVERAFRN